MKIHKSTLEICCYSFKSAIIAQNAGADRIELCSGILEGGLTPSIGQISKVLQNTIIPVNIIIRPRGGDFLYSDDEFEVIKTDIIEIKKLKPNGFVFGVLKSDGTLDFARMKILCELAKPYQITFHRAFDMCKNPETTIKQLIELGVDIILTSGQKKNALSGIKNLKQYNIWAENKIQIMAGAGVNYLNIPEIKQKTGINNFHLSAKVSIESQMRYFNNDAKMGEENENEYVSYEADCELIKKAALVLKNKK